LERAFARDVVEAVHFYKLAIEDGDKDAKAAYERLCPSAEESPFFAESSAENHL
jgi:hypothetical protein